MAGLDRNTALARAPRLAEGGRTVGEGLFEGLLNAPKRLIQKDFNLPRKKRESPQRPRPAPAVGPDAIRLLELERQRLGRDLHTGVGQMLAAMHLQLETIGAQSPPLPPAVRHALKRIGELTGQAMEEVRAVSRRLHPPEWQRLSLPEAIRQLWELSGWSQGAGSQIALAAGLEEPELEIKILIYRSLQEALSNIARHARATAVTVSLEPRGGRLVLTVRDNGVGFPAAALWKAPAHLEAGIGLRSIREQAAAWGGELMVHSGPHGTTLEVSIPQSEPPRL